MKLGVELAHYIIIITYMYKYYLNDSLFDVAHTHVAITWLLMIHIRICGQLFILNIII